MIRVPGVPGVPSVPGFRVPGSKVSGSGFVALLLFPWLASAQGAAVDTDAAKVVRVVRVASPPASDERHHLPRSRT
jgi:hypothetical protein